LASEARPLMTATTRAAGLVLEAETTVGMFNVKWKFPLEPFGSARHQSELLRDQLILPTSEMVRLLLFKLDSISHRDSVALVPSPGQLAAFRTFASSAACQQRFGELYTATMQLRINEEEKVAEPESYAGPASPTLPSSKRKAAAPESPHSPKEYQESEEELKRRKELEEKLKKAKEKQQQKKKQKFV